MDEILKRNNITSWLHISDLHVFPEADTTLILEDYAELARVISPQFLIVTGDFRHLKYKTNFNPTKLFLESILEIFHLEKKDTFLVPGNHDVNPYADKDNIIFNICSQSEANYNIYSQYITSLYSGFWEYDAFIRDFYNESGIVDERIINPSKVYCIEWNDLINIVVINTALISDGGAHKQIIDINDLTNCIINPKHPTLLLGHHWIESLYSSHRQRVESIIDRRQISAYLHGDIHKYANNPIQKISIPNKTIPSIACGKSAPQSGDSYSDVGVIYYEWKPDNNVYIQAFRWSHKGFKEDPTYDYKINKKQYFPMLYIDKFSNLLEQIPFLAHNQQDKFMEGGWVKEAENLWKKTHVEIIGRGLLLFYYVKAQNGFWEAFRRANEIYSELELTPNKEPKTQQMLLITKEYLHSNKY